MRWRTKLLSARGAPSNIMSAVSGLLEYMKSTAKAVTDNETGFFSHIGDIWVNFVRSLLERSVVMF